MSKVNESVLVVEDDAELREALVDTLRAAGLSALSAPDAPAALQSLESEEIALVISDVQMPGPNGYQLLSSIKQRRPDLPVVLMTAYGTVAQAVAAMREGATDYIVKPFDAQALPTSRSITRPSPRTCSRPPSSVTRKAPSRAHSAHMPANSSRRRAAP